MHKQGHGSVYGESWDQQIDESYSRRDEHKATQPGEKLCKDLEAKHHEKSQHKGSSDQWEHKKEEEKSVRKASPEAMGY